MEYNTFVCECNIESPENKKKINLKSYKCILKNYLNYAKVRRFINIEKFDELQNMVMQQTDDEMNINIMYKLDEIDYNSIYFGNIDNNANNNNNNSNNQEWLKMFEAKITLTFVNFFNKHIHMDGCHELEKINYYHEQFEILFNKKKFFK